MFNTPAHVFDDALLAEPSIVARDVAGTVLARADVIGPARGAMPHFGPPDDEPFIAQLFQRVCDARASDLHLCTMMPPLVRIDGEIRPLADDAPLTSDMLEHLLAQIMPARNRDEFEAYHETDFAYDVPGLARFRGNVFLDRRGIGAVFHVIPWRIPTAETVGLSPQVLDLCRVTQGLVLVTGPAGSGKSTTLAALVDHINRSRTGHIITIEDPIEFVHEHGRCLVHQREVQSHTRSFRHALRAALREDPDVLVVGELHDPDTIAIAIEAAESGHLVFGALRTTTAASTIDRLIDQFPADRQPQIRARLSESLRGVIAQTLCRKAGGGRVAAREVLLIDPAIGDLIREGKTSQIPSKMQTGGNEGTTPLEEALADLVKRNLVTDDEAMRRAVDKPGMATRLTR